jgi:hypothetical protein
MSANDKNLVPLEHREKMYKAVRDIIPLMEEAYNKKCDVSISIFNHIEPEIVDDFTEEVIIPAKKKGTTITIRIEG